MRQQVVLHGVYDRLAGIQPTVAAGVAIASVVLFDCYLEKLKSPEVTPQRPSADSGPETIAGVGTD